MSDTLILFLSLNQRRRIFFACTISIASLSNFLRHSFFHRPTDWLDRDTSTETVVDNKSDTASCSTLSLHWCENMKKYGCEASIGIVMQFSIFTHNSQLKVTCCCCCCTIHAIISSSICFSIFFCRNCFRTFYSLCHASERWETREREREKGWNLITKKKLPWNFWIVIYTN